MTAAITPQLPQNVFAQRAGIGMPQPMQGGAPPMRVAGFGAMQPQPVAAAPMKPGMGMQGGAPPMRVAMPMQQAQPAGQTQMPQQPQNFLRQRMGIL